MRYCKKLLSNKSICLLAGIVLLLWMASSCRHEKDPMMEPVVVVPMDTVPVVDTTPPVLTLWDSLILFHPVGTCHYIHIEPFDSTNNIDTIYSSQFIMRRRDSMYVDIEACGWPSYYPMGLPANAPIEIINSSGVVTSTIFSITIDPVARTIHTHSRYTPPFGAFVYYYTGDWSF